MKDNSVRTIVMILAGGLSLTGLAVAARGFRAARNRIKTHTSGFEWTASSRFDEDMAQLPIRGESESIPTTGSVQEYERDYGQVILPESTEDSTSWQFFASGTPEEEDI